ncbi:MAG: hypothetical protein WC551_09265 [Patescibacteria group bacterium]
MAGNVNLLQFGEGGGILSDAIVVLHDPHFLMSNTVAYGKSMAKTAPLLFVRMTETAEDGAELDHEQYLSLGGADDFAPTEDGLGLTKIGTKDAIVKTTNYAVFIQSIMDAGFPPERTKENDISFLEGLKCHVTRKVVTRDGLEKRAGRDATVLIVDKLYLDEKPAAKKGAKVGAGTKQAPEAALIEEAKSILTQVLYSDSATDGSIAKNKLIPSVLSLIKDNPNKKELTKIIIGDEFLNLCDGWTYEKGVIAVG